MKCKTKLSDKQWNEIGDRYLRGEGSRKLAKEFNVPESTIRTRWHAQSERIKHSANQIISAEIEIKKLGDSAQVRAKNYMDELRLASIELASAALNGAVTAKKLSSIAKEKAEKITGDIGDKEELSLINGLTVVANSSAKIATDLIRTVKTDNQEAIDAQDADPMESLMSSIHENNKGLPKNGKHRAMERS